MSEAIVAAACSADYDAFGALVSEYVAWCRARYQHDAWFVDQAFGHQGMADELRDLATTYGPPNGRTLLASCDGTLAAGGAYRRLSDGTCEMKRLYVADRFRGRGLGRRLGSALIESARAEGCALMRLDTGNLLQEAIALYESLGFRRCAPHRSYPPDLLRYLVFMELPLKE